MKRILASLLLTLMLGLPLLTSCVPGGYEDDNPSKPPGYEDPDADGEPDPGDPAPPEEEGTDDG